MSEELQRTSTRAIPATRRVAVHSAEHMPHDYSTTPGGTLFSTTPGGTRIIYDRKFLLECRRSPVANTPPRGLPDIPGVTSPPSSDSVKEKAHNGEPLNNNIISPTHNKSTGDEAQFEMDI